MCKLERRKPRYLGGIFWLDLARLDLRMDWDRKGGI